MKKFTLLALLAIFSLTFSYGQRKSSKITPAKANIEFTKNCDFVQLPGLSKEYIDQENAKQPKDGSLWEIGRRIPANLSMENSGTWFDAPNGDRVWVLRVKTPGAIAITAEISDLFIPVGGSLYIYDPAGNTSYGRYSNADNAEFFGSDFIMGDEVIFEYIQPANVTGTASMRIDDLMHLYRGVSFKGSKSLYGNWQGSESCEVNIICTPEGTNWVDEAKGVCVIYVVTSAGAGWCTGSLINNTAQNCTPYLLSAWHCYEGATAANLNSWRFLFKYQSTTCTTQATEPVYTMLTGCTLKAQGSINGGSDFLLVLLNTAIPTTINAYMNGWNKSTTASTGGVSIHHPAGDIKKISTYTSSLVSSSYTGGATGAHWRVTWAATSNGHGVTEGGSSGSPIFDNNGYIVGTLTGGGSYCTATSNPDYYGKLSYHWNSTANGTTDAYRLQPWLDPTNSGVTTLTGMACPATTTTLTADFSGTPTTVTVGQTVTFTNTSTGSPTTYSWNFGANASLATATTAGPHAVTYSATGLKTVTLTVGNGTTTDTETKTAYINVTNVPTGCDTLHYPLVGTATIYTATNGGYVAGNNSYGDLAKADYFTGATAGFTISDAYVYFGVAKGSSSQVAFKVWNDNGTSNAPNTVIGTTTVPISTIVTNVTAQSPTLAHFTSPVVQDGSFYVGVVLPTIAGDSLAIISNTEGDITTGTAWEQWDSGVWYAFNNASAWELELQLAIWPILCNPTNVSTSAANNLVSMYPNPANNQLNIYFGDYSGNVDISICDILGKEVLHFNSSTDNSSNNTFDISSLKNGLYIVNGIFGEKSFTDKLQVIK